MRVEAKGEVQLEQRGAGLGAVGAPQSCELKGEAALTLLPSGTDAEPKVFMIFFF